jgi:hypothetical protein
MIGPCYRFILFPNKINVFLCYYVIMLLCYYVIMLLCYYVRCFLKLDRRLRFGRASWTDLQFIRVEELHSRES